MSHKRRLALAGVATLALGSLLLFLIEWRPFGQDPLGSTTDAGLQRGIDAAMSGPPKRLADLTDFRWDQLRTFSFGTSDGTISDEAGSPVDWKPHATSYTEPSLWVFSQDGEAVRAVQLDANAAEPGVWSDDVQVSGGPRGNLVTLQE